MLRISRMPARSEIDFWYFYQKDNIVCWKKQMTDKGSMWCFPYTNFLFFTKSNPRRKLHNKVKTPLLLQEWTRAIDVSQNSNPFMHGIFTAVWPARAFTKLPPPRWILCIQACSIISGPCSMSTTWKCWDFKLPILFFFSLGYLIVFSGVFLRFLVIYYRRIDCF